MRPENQDHENPVDWSSCTWQGAREAHLEAFRRLSFQDKLQALEEWCDISRSMITRRQRRGLPTIPLQTDDPATQKANPAAQGQ